MGSTKMGAILVLILWGLMVIPQVASAQAEKYLDQLKLTNGSVLWGITEIKGDQVVVHLDPEETVSLPVTLIKSLKTQKLNPAFYQLPTPGTYYQISLGTLIGKSHSASVNQATFNVSAVGGYRFNSYWSAGLGAGNYYYPQMRLIPLFAEAQGYLLESQWTPTYFLRAGWGWASQRKDQGVAVEDVKGGLFLEPGVGLKWHHAGHALHLRLSYVRQKSKTFYEPVDFGNGNVISNVETRTFERINLNVGFSF